MDTQTFHYEPLTWGDFATLHTGYPVYTLIALFAYAFVLSLLLPGNVRVWGGILREAALTFYDETVRLHHFVVRLLLVLTIRTAVRMGGRLARTRTAPAELVWMDGAAMPHPPRGACANPTTCPDCRTYL